MYFRNDSAWRQTGLPSRSLSQIIQLLLTAWTGCESGAAACLPECHFSGEQQDWRVGGWGEQLLTETQKKEPPFLPV